MHGGRSILSQGQHLNSRLAAQGGSHSAGGARTSDSRSKTAAADGLEASSASIRSRHGRERLAVAASQMRSSQQTRRSGVSAITPLADDSASAQGAAFDALSSRCGVYKRPLPDGSELPQNGSRSTKCAPRGRCDGRGEEELEALPARACSAPAGGAVG